MTAVTRPLPGELIYRSPECPLCGEETECDGDSFRCRACRCSWGTRFSDEGLWDDPDEPVCPKALAHARHPILSGRCVLGEGHEGEHNNRNTTWRSNRLLDSTESEATS